MGLFRRKREVQTFSLGPIRLEAAAFMEALGDSPWMDKGEFDLRGFITEMFESGFLSTAEMLKALGKDAEAFWLGTNLDEQWDRGSRVQREEALKTAMQFQNALDGVEQDNEGAVVLHATMRLKALLLATGCDATYRTDFLQRIVADPAQFGVHEFRR
jgi:hypothetical protein